MTDYQKQANDFLQATETTFTAKFYKHGYHFSGDTDTRNIYSCTLKNDKHKYNFKFGQSIHNSKKCIAPTAYDVLACLEKHEVGTFDDFCSEFGYDNDSRRAFKTYKAVKREWENIKLLFTTEQIELLQEIQ